MSPAQTGFSRALSGNDLARELARLRLGATRTDRSPGSLADALTVGQAIGLNVSEMRRVAGCSRQTIYNALRDPIRPVKPPDAQVALEALVVLVAADGALRVAELAGRLRLESLSVLGAVQGLAAQDLCGFDGPDDSSAAWATERADEVLREDLDDLLVARPDSVAVYLHVEEIEADRIDSATHDLVSHHEYVLMRANLAPSVMSGPELALAVRAPTVRRAMAIAASLWDEVRNRAGLEPRPARFATVIPPAIPPHAGSLVLDAFLDAVVDVAPEAEAEADLARSRYPGGVDERRLAGHCLTAAARALRSSLEQDREPRPIEHGEAAFFELQAVMPMHLDAPREKIQRALVTALKRAVEHLGPVPGGRLASFRGPAGPNVVEEVHPTTEDLEFIAHHSGVGVGHAATLDYVDAGAELLRIATGR